jgi:hypothetical protein
MEMAWFIIWKHREESGNVVSCVEDNYGAYGIKCQSGYFRMSMG